MPKDDDIYLILGKLLEGQENIERGMAGLHKRIDEKIMPVLEDYTANKNRFLGACFAISGSVGGGVAWVMKMFKDT